MATGASVQPEVFWAQRSSASEPEKNFVYLTLTVPDVPEKDMTLDLQPTKLTFKGHSTSKNVTYATELEFYAEIEPKESKTSHTGKNIEMVLRKKELGEEYWPRLLKEKAKVHFLKTDFDKWVDEDEQDENEADPMAGMGGMGDMGGFGGGGDGGFGNIDFSKLGGMEGLGGMGGMGGMAGMGEDMGDDDDEGDEDEDEEEMPGLEGADKGKAAVREPELTGSKKIEEVE